jgi:hypothetical protein
METQSKEQKLGVFGDRLRTSLARVQKRGGAMLERVEARARAGQERWREDLLVTPREMRRAFKRILLRARKALDLPSRSELLAIGQRLEQIDRKLRKLEEARAADVKKLKRNIKSAVHVAKQAKASLKSKTKPKTAKNGES